MLFNSFEFILLFLPVVLAGYQLCALLSRTAAIWWLTILSVVFYGVWDQRAVLFLISSILVNYIGAVLITRFRESRRLQTACLVTTIAIDLGALCYYKYLFSIFNFFHNAGVLSWTFTEVILPLGISFFTFTQIAYLIDLKGGEAELEPFRNYAFFVTFFPHLIAGPILHHHEIMPQLMKRTSFGLSADDLSSGLTLFVIGLFKKVIFADKIAVYVAPLFNNPEHASLGMAWMGSLCYAMQLYFDFSGYSDMAIGLALMFSIRFPLNFNSPYKAKSIIEFWQRFHMTLSRYLNLYLYNPISLAITRREIRSGKKFSPKAKLTLAAFAKRLAIPTVVTMFLAGVWHGAGLQFLIFGLLHGAYLTINQGWRMFGNVVRSWASPISIRLPRLFPTLSVLIVFVAVIVGQIFFRARSVQDALHIVGALAGLHGLSLRGSGAGLMQVAFLTALLTIVWFCPNSQQLVRYSPSNQPMEPSVVVRPIKLNLAWQPSPAWAVVLAFLFIWSLMATTNRSEFLYFKF